MCIRDRGTTEDLFFRMDACCAPCIRIFAGSDTFLLHRPAALRRRCLLYTSRSRSRSHRHDDGGGARAPRPHRGGDGAVSYTHLDVYKRQGKGRGHHRCRRYLLRIHSCGGQRREIGADRAAGGFGGIRSRSLAHRRGSCLLYTSRCV